ncbi:hypothetical protein ACH5RR_035137 [Cinchona calisaya]|uniref:Uncharacterized protein n=1 Tax=Cinchona calisaya TaxID=153742 RepID=A0ABD2YCZ7_9GENT
MGKTKAVKKKTKELSVAVAESSSFLEAAEGQQPQPLSPRKRGRPRKVIVEKTEVEEVKDEETAKESHDVEGSESKKKVKTSTEEEEEEEGLQQLSKTTTTSSSRKQFPAPRSRASRRKSKPRKCS